MRYFPLKTSALALILLSIVTPSISAPVKINKCFTYAARDFNIDSDLLLAIAIQESKLNNNAFNAKTNDYCLMQINQQHKTILRRFNISMNELRNNPCVCIYTGAWVLAKDFKAYGRNWKSVGRYNAGSRDTTIANKNRKTYASKIKSIYTVIKKDSNKKPDTGFYY